MEYEWDEAKERMHVSNDGSLKKSETDWDRLQMMTDANIDASDIPPITRDALRRAELVLPVRRERHPA